MAGPSTPLTQAVLELASTEPNMFFVPALFSALAALVPRASAETFDVSVGEGGGLTFTPNTVTANVGDTVTFTLFVISSLHLGVHVLSAL